MSEGTFSRMVEVGRVVLLNDVANNGRLATIVDIVDHNRALVDGPTSGVARHAHSFKRLTLTPLKVSSLPRGVRSGTLRKALEAQGIQAKWESSGWATKLKQRSVRATLTDFDRFKLMKLRKQRRTIVNAQVAKLRKEKN